MTILRALVNIPMDSGLPEDSCTNTWHFDSDVGPPATDAALVNTALTTFYQAIDVYLSIRCNTPATVKYYDLSDPEPRSPVYTGSIALTPGTGNPLPSEIALCLSYQAARVSGLPQSRRRGRVYIGPLDAAAAGAAPSTSDRPNTAFRAALAAAAAILEDDAAAAGVDWYIYSPTNGTAVVVTDGWVDDAFDVQRRRGVASTARTLWS